MALDHRSLDLQKQILGKQIRPNFLRLTSLLYKILLRNLGAYFYTSHLRCKGTMRCCFYNSDLGQQYFTILEYKLFSFNIQDDQSMHGLLAKLLKKFPKSPIRPVSCELWSVNEWTLIEFIRFNIIKNLSCLFLFIFYLVVL